MNKDANPVLKKKTLSLLTQSGFLFWRRKPKNQKNF